jgi:hypothetical protein
MPTLTSAVAVKGEAHNDANRIVPINSLFILSLLNPWLFSEYALSF